ncbi:E3 binding domain-containing protein [Deinococcus planocerae]|uniref:E3 binding domain-containing protein n=1 Tax=Deinococcus planocerae TaxID=1737569 RepID=UPI000C7F42F9|nr:E3 binding domain-containing protein [Deinococcus planocerae]
MERIAPLARVLAEANGIDWQPLRGTGQGGLIVEGDILAHLARIMSGEEEPPATPVDAPPPDWTGEDLSASLITPGLPSADALRGAGVDSDITAFVAQARTTPAPAPALEDDALDFELDDDQADFEPAPVVAAPAASAPAPAWNFNAPAPVTPPPPVAAGVPSQPFLPAAASTPPEPAHAEPVPVAATAAPAASAGLSAGLGGLLSRLYQPAAPAPQPASPAPVQPPVVQVPVLPEPQPTPAFQAPAAPEARLPEPPAFPLPDLHAQAPLPADEPEIAPLAPTLVAEPQVEDLLPAPAVMEAVEAPAFEPDGETAPPALVADSAREARSFGTYLRRDVNVSSAADLRRQLAGALGQDVPLGLLVVRAAQRHAQTLGLGSVALQDLTAGVARTARPVALRDALDDLGTPFGGTPDLLVTDAGTLDLDDLHLGHTVTLSVGREREGRAALSLSGDVDPTRAARFLADVAGALEAPIILVI